VGALTANGIVGGMMNSLRQASGGTSVTVWVYTGDVRVIEGDTSFGGENKVKFLVE